MNKYSWFDHYDHGVPRSLAPYPEKSLFESVSEAARIRPNAPFLLFKGRSLSYGEVDHLSDRLADALIGLGVHPGDRVALILVNSPQAVIGELGVWKAGAVAVPLNPMYTEKELEHALTDVGASVAIVLTLSYRRLKTVQPHTSVKTVIATKIKDYLPRHLAVLFTVAKEKKLGHRINLAKEDFWFTDIIRRSHIEHPRPEVGPDDPALLLFTGGTTGIPRAAVIKHQGLVMTGMQAYSWVRNVFTSWESVFMSLMPLFHVYGTGVLAGAIVSHCPLALVPDPRDLDDVLATIRKTRPALLPAVPTFYASLLEHPLVKAARVNLTSIKLCLSGAAPLMAETKKRFEAATGGKLIELYSLTEAALALIGNPVHGVNKPGSIGIPLPDVEVRIVDSDSGKQELPRGEIGEIVMRAPQVMSGYWGSPPESESILREGWLYTGDLGYMDEDGYVFLIDRKKDVIKPGGFQVWPREVEEVIAAHPAVANVAVAGVPDPHQGEAVKAWVVLKQNTYATADDIRAHCRQHLAAYKVPRQVEFRPELPKTMIGKVLRRALREEEGTVRSVAA